MDRSLWPRGDTQGVIGSQIPSSRDDSPDGMELAASASPRGGSQDPEFHRPRRPRVIYSCLPCRKQKLKCDRKVPCSRCVKNKRELQCITPTSNISISGRSGSGNRVNGNGHGNGHGNGDGGEEMSPKTVTFVDKDWLVHSRNGTHWNRLLDEIKSHLSGHNDFNLHGDPETMTMDLSINYPVGNLLGSPEMVRRIAKNLPPLELQEIFISNYMNTIEESLHLLDKRSWDRELLDFRQDTTSQTDDWLAQYLMILSLGCQAYTRMRGAHKGNKNTSVFHDLSLRLMQDADICLKQTPYFFKPTLTGIRTLYLMVLSKQIFAYSCHESDACWPLTGLIKRLAMRIGLHNPSHRGSESLSMGELRMRRRLWVAVVYLEMRQALVCGMPVLLRPVDVACIGRRRGVYYPETSYDGDMTGQMDRSVDEDVGETLMEKTFSAVGVQILQALELATSGDDTFTYDDVVSLDVEIKQRLEQSGISLLTFEKPVSFDGVTPGELDLEACTVHLFIRIVLLSLHTHFALHPNSPTSYPISYVSSLESSLSILTSQHILYESDPTEKDKGQVTWFAGVFRHEFFTAAMTVTYQLVRGGHHSDLPSSQLCEGRPREIILDALRSCRDIWDGEKEGSMCNANAFDTVDGLLKALERDESGDVSFV